MRAFLVIVACLALADESLGAQPEPWISEPPLEAFLKKYPAVSEKDYYEVVASMRENSEIALRTRAFIPISDALAKKYAGVHFTCPDGKRPYLVRALYAFAGTGRFRVSKFERAILVLHESLGSEYVISRSALVVNLDLEPTHVYVSVSVAE